MAKSKNLKISCEEYKLAGTLSSEEFEDMSIETEDGEIPLRDIFIEFDGCEVEFNLKKKVEEQLV